MAERARHGKALLTVSLSHEADFLLARRRASEIARLLGMDRQDQTRVATAVSEIARNAFVYGGGGKAEFFVERSPRLALRVVIQDRGPGIAHLDAIWSGTYRSTSGMGMGILGSKRISDDFDIETGESGTTVTLVKHAPWTAGVTAPTDEALTKGLAAGRALDASTVLVDQNQELIQLLDQLRAREKELERLNRELEETNRGVMVLYSELDDKAHAVQQANEMKSRFLSSVTHELRTPLNSIVSLSRLLLLHQDGTLTAEQDKQVVFILRSAQNMTEMVSDLLDLAKIEAGKVTLKRTEVLVSDVFSALRGMFRPLVQSESVQLRFEDPEPGLVLITDEGKLAQILRNFVSNGLKFTSAGEVVVRAVREGESVVFSVRDTGLGIAPEHRELVLQEWGQVGAGNSGGQRGSGLGLPLAKNFAELLGGEMWFTSELGRGSEFFVRLPAGIDIAGAEARDTQAPREGTVLVVDDDEVWRYLLRRRLEELTTARVVEAADGRSGLELLQTVRPALLLLDLAMPEMSGVEVLQEVRRLPEGADLRAIVVTSKELTEAEGAVLRGLDAEVLGKKDSFGAEHRVSLERALMDVGLLNLHERSV